MHWEKCRNKDLWFNEECIQKRRELKEPIRKLKEKDDDDDDDESSSEYWESRKIYGRTVREQDVALAGGSRVH
jgi:hypothetical protein